MEEEKCEECKGKLVNKGHEIFCEDCGLVVDDCPVNFGKEYPSSEKEARMRRTGPPVTFLNPDTGTTFDIKKKRR